MNNWSAHAEHVLLGVRTDMYCLIDSRDQTVSQSNATANQAVRFNLSPRTVLLGGQGGPSSIFLQGRRDAAVTIGFPQSRNFELPKMEGVHVV